MKQRLILIAVVIINLMSCKDFLDEKPRKSLAVPGTLKDYQALLEKETESQQDPRWGEVSTDDFYYDDAVLASKVEVERNVYLWDGGDVFGTVYDLDWFSQYKFIYHTNTVLEGIQEIERNNANAFLWDKAKGEALFFRAKCHLNIANIWSSGYNSATASSDPGIALRLSANFNEVSVRSSQMETYHQIITDLKASADLLPLVPIHLVRPSKPAALALLARVYLFMGNYEECLKYADACLKLKDDLMDYNTLSFSASYPMSLFNKEVIYHSYLPTSLINGKVSDQLYSLYGQHDLRRSLFFKTNVDASVSFKGSYYGGTRLFSGLAVDEIYLMRAECNARTGHLADAMDDLNSLLKKRFDKNYFVPVNAATKEDALKIIIAERRKELLLRGIRWPDVKRQNIAGAGISLKRLENATENILLPNDPKFALPFPIKVIELSGMAQNPR